MKQITLSMCLGVVLATSGHAQDHKLVHPLWDAGSDIEIRAPDEKIESRFGLEGFSDQAPATKQELEYFRGQNAKSASTTQSRGGALCDMGPLISKNTYHGNFKFASQTIPYSTSTIFNFTPINNRLTLIKETTSVIMPEAETKISYSIINMTAEIPKDTCDINTNITSNSVFVNNGSLTSRLNFTGEKWGCVIFDSWCPTWKEPGRTCRETSKTIVGSGSGSISVYLTPAIFGNKININFSSDTDFRLDTTTQIIGNLISGALLGPSGNLGFRLFTDTLVRGIGEMKINAAYVIDPPTAAQNEIYQPQISSARFRDLTGSGISLDVSRETQMKAGSACFFRSQLR